MNVGDALQLNIYNEKSYLPTHTDSDWGTGQSIYFGVTCLQPCEKGGNFYLLKNKEKKIEIKLKQGQCVISRNLPHGVTTIEKGQRISCIFRYALL